MEPQPQLINSVDHLRHLIGQAQPGERLFVQIAPNISFKDVRMLWEAASLDEELEGLHKVFNPEMLRSKMMAADFIDNKVRELKRERDYLNGRIGCMQSWYNLKERELDNGGPHISKEHVATLMFGPQMHLDVNKIGTMFPEELKDHRREILDEYLYLPVSSGQATRNYYKPELAQMREFDDQRSLKKINMQFLKIRIEGFVLLRDRISAGIKYLEGLSSARIFMGCGDADFTSFRDCGIGNIPDGVDEIIG